MNSNNRNFLWGLYQKETRVAIPLKSLDVSVKILHNVAQVFYTQNYYNNTNALLESEFFFPISPEACFDSFEAKFNDTVIKGVIKKKEEAKEEYKEAISQGKTAAYSEINQDTGDLMKVLIGNIPPETGIAITFSYIEKLETVGNKFWSFRLFSTLTPRYNGNIQEYLKEDIALLASYPTIYSSDPQAYPWNIEVEIQSKNPITLLKSPSHEIVPVYGNENHTCHVKFASNTKQFPNKNFVLFYANSHEHEKVDYLMTPFEDGYCAMVTLQADFESVSVENAYENLVKAKETENDFTVDIVKGEYIFLIDRSGSMRGERIQVARNSLVLFLKSLPNDSLFNIVSFGSNYQFLHDNSQSYSQQSLEDAISKVEEFNADMGGTEIFHALLTIFKTPLKSGYPRFLFLLTDGAVSNTSQVLKLISENNDKAKVFTIGIGSGCSPELITKAAFHGKGKHEFVSNNNEIYEKVISLLNASLCPSYSDLTFQANNFDALVKAVSPNPASIPCLLNGQSLTFFFLLRQEAFAESKVFSINLELYDTKAKKKRSIEIKLNATEAVENQSIPKLAIFDMIRRLDDEKNDLTNSEKQLVWAGKEEIKKNLIELSLKYGVLCKETAFFCEITNKEEKITRDVERIKVTVPTLSENEQLLKTSASERSSKNEQKRREKLSALKKRKEERSKKEVGIVTQITQTFSGAFNSFFGREERKDSRNLKAKFQQYPEQKSTAYNINECMSCDDYYESSPPKAASNKSTSNSYLNVIMKQKFEGYWDPNDPIVKQTVLIGGLPEIPDAIKNDPLAKEIWITVLVLLWLETACQKDKKAWQLIYQKGYNWLKDKSVKYEEIKTLGVKAIQPEDNNSDSDIDDFERRLEALK